MGQSPASSTYNDTKVGLPFYQGNADFGDLYPKPRIWCDKPIKIAKRGDILISVRAPIGALNYAKEECCIGRGIASITIDDNNFSREFIYWCLKNKTQQLQNMGTGSTFKAINKKNLEEIKIPKIELDIQLEIVNNLQKANQIIKDYNTEYELLDELVKARFVEMFGDPIINDKSLPMRTLSSLSVLKAGKAIKTGELVDEDDCCLYPCYGGNGIRGFINRYSNEGDFPIIGRQGAWAGNVNFASGKFYATEHAIVVTPLIDLNTIWYYYALKLLDLTRFQTGAAQPGLAVDRLKKINIPFPPIELQNQFADFVRETDKSRLHVLYIS